MKKIFLAILFIILCYSTYAFSGSIVLWEGGYPSGYITELQISSNNISVRGSDLVFRPGGMPSGATTTVPSCSTSNDSALIDKNTQTDNNYGSAWKASKFTLASESTITEYIIYANDINTDTGSYNISIYTHNSGSNCPLTEISGTEVNLLATALSNFPTFENKTITLSTPKTGIASGTYWIVIECVSSSQNQFGYASDTGGRMILSADGTTWTDSYDNFSYQFEVWGCQP